MKLIPIDYNDGQIWVNLSSKDFIGKTIYCHGEVFSLTEWDGEGKGFMSTVIAQSPNLSLPNTPYVEIEEETIELSLADNDYKEEGTFSTVSIEAWRDIFIAGYRKASAKKYTEEDLKNAFKAGRKGYLDGFNLKHYDFYSANNYLQSLQPKVVSIEIETRIVDDSEWNDEHSVCYREGDKEEAVTYQKDGKKFIKVKQVNYEKDSKSI